MAFEWTPERIEELLSLWRQGLTSYQMAAHFGVSRSAVCGKIHRERVKANHVIERRREPRRRSSPTDKPRSKKPMLTLPESAGSVSRIVSPALPVFDDGRLASILDVTGCRWPVKDDPAFVGGVAFCNHAQKDGSSYCAHHAQINKAPYSDELLRRTYKQINFILKRAA